VRRDGQERAVTIQDVAIRSGVSISTVWRVVTGSVAVEPATAERVREAIATLGYRPNLLARSFRRRVAHTIDLLVPENSNQFFAEMACTYDQLAIGAIGALQRAGYRVPENISVVGFDDIPQSAANFPALTTIAQPIGKMGRIGVRLLFDRIARGHPKGLASYQRVRLSTRLVVRESTSPLSVLGVGMSVSR
jgi:DNA-binding LacI/PurR family transcriptional regulator